MNVTQFLHASLLVSDTQRAVDFYRTILGLQPNANRPDLGYPGAWLDIGAQQIHLLELPNPDPVQGRPEHGGRDRRTAAKIGTIQYCIFEKPLGQGGGVLPRP